MINQWREIKKRKMFNSWKLSQMKTQDQLKMPKMQKNKKNLPQKKRRLLKS